MQSNFFIPQYEPKVGYYERVAVNSYMQNPGFLTEYKQTQEFENAIAKYLNIKNCIVCNNGTISLSLALLALGIKPGDSVLVPDLTMIATANAVKLIGANPIFVDVDNSLLMDFQKADIFVNVYKQIKAIIFVSLNGRSFPNTAWGYIWKWKEAGIALIEDAAQSFGSKTYEDYFCGTRGFTIGSFSFSMPKIICSGGQGGCLVTNDEDVANRLRKLKDFGRCSGGNDIHDAFGINSKFTELQAVIGKEQLLDIEYRTKRKKEVFKLYRDELKSCNDVNFIDTDLNTTVPWFVDIFVKDPNSLALYLKNSSIGTRRIYPPIHKQEAYKPINDWVYPNTERLSSMGLWLPSSFNLTNEQIIYICNKIKEFYV